LEVFAEGVLEITQLLELGNKGKGDFWLRNGILVKEGS
jgi:hypothetical protein